VPRQATDVGLHPKEHTGGSRRSFGIGPWALWGEGDPTAQPGP